MFQCFFLIVLFVPDWIVHSTKKASVGSEIGLYFDPEDIHVMRFNESEAEFDARLESYEDQGEDDETI